MKKSFKSDHMPPKLICTSFSFTNLNYKDDFELSSSSLIHLNKLTPNTQAAHPYSRAAHAWRTITESSLRMAGGLLAATCNSRRHRRRQRRTTSQRNVGGAHVLGDGWPPLVLSRRQRRRWSRLIKAALVDIKAAAMVSLSTGIKLASNQPRTGQTVDQAGQFLVHFEVRCAGLANCR